jgi:gluconokinase
MPAVLALDVGTSSCRASLYDLSAEPVPGRAAQVHYSPRVTPDGGAELDPQTLLNDVVDTIDQVLASASTEIVAVATSTFWHSLIGVDAAGRPLTPVYLWMDARARGQLAALRQRLDEHAVHTRTGCTLHWSYWPARLTWLRATQPDVCARVARWISFGELLLAQLTDQNAVSLSMASGTGLLNLRTCTWDTAMLEAIGLDAEHLSPLTDLTPAGMVTRSRWPELKGVPWLPAVGDGACSNLGAGCVTSHQFALMVGTSGAERAAWSPPADFEVPRGAWCYRIDRRRMLLGGALNDGGALVDWLLANLRLPDPPTLDAELDALEPDSHGLTVLPFWAGERSPGYADDARGAITGLRLSTRPIEILRACLEAVALRFAAIDRILLETLPDAREVIATGGALLHRPAWMQILADALGRPVAASSEAEASSRGAALLALEALGCLDGPLESQRPATTRTFEPVPERTERYRGALQRQQRLYDALIT